MGSNWLDAATDWDNNIMSRNLGSGMNYLTTVKRLKPRTIRNQSKLVCIDEVACFLVLEIDCGPLKIIIVNVQFSGSEDAEIYKDIIQSIPVIQKQ